MFQCDSDGSDSQESSEEAEQRRKKIEALKVSLISIAHTYININYRTHLKVGQVWVKFNILSCIY